MTTDVGAERKIVSLDEIAAVRAQLRETGDTVVLAHGVFDLLHPGHVGHLEQAAALADRLVVSVTADEHVARGPGRPVFNHDLRMHTLAALECVDWVVLSDAADALAVIDAVQPDVYCKGREYAESDAPLSRGIEVETRRVEELGGETRYLGGIVYSSTKLLNHHFDVLPAPARAFADDLRTRYDMDAIRSVVESMSGIRALVVGEVIVDEYVYSDFQGLTGKDRAPSVRHREAERQWGGAYAVARHLSAFCGGVTLTGIAQPGSDLALPATPPGTPDEIERAFELDEAARTVVKRRYVVENKLREELDKLFSVNYLPEIGEISEDTRRRFRDRLAGMVDEHDVVVLLDYGHGLMDRPTIELLQDRSPFLALNCQTNSANFGFNPITKYRRADSFALDEAEIALAFGDRTSPRQELLGRLHQHLGSRYGWLTLGAAGSLAIDEGATLSSTPALTLHVRDTIGAGDAFFALASLAACVGQPIEVGSFLGNLAGGLAANVVGNTASVEKTELLKFAGVVLNV
jgi:rfaE bifunctional protein nucleotidyltransferase chain/domain